jgi:hypothetical protein
MTLPSLPLPDFAFVTENHYGVIVVGRAIAEGVLTPPSRVKAVRDAVNNWAERTGLPLAYVHMGTTINWSVEDDEDGGEWASAVIGLVTAYVDGTNQFAPAAKVGKEALDGSLYERIPAGMWSELEKQHGVTFGRAEKRDGNWKEVDEPGVYLVPSGWSVASLYLAGSADLDESGRPQGRAAATAASDDTSVGKRLDSEEYGSLRTTADDLLLWATYA